PVLGGWAKILGGWALADRGDCAAAVAEIRQGLAGLLHGTCRTYFLALLAEVCARAGRPQEGLVALAEGQEIAKTKCEFFWEPEIHRLKGELLLQHDPATAPDAEACFHQALAVARGHQARALELRAAMSLGRLWSRQGQTEAARELVATVYDAF